MDKFRYEYGMWIIWDKFIYLSLQAVEISRTDYELSDIDILYAEGITSSNSLASMDFSFPMSAGNSNLDPPYQHDPSLMLGFLIHALIK